MRRYLCLSFILCVVLTLFPAARLHAAPNTAKAQPAAAAPAPSPVIPLSAEEISRYPELSGKEQFSFLVDFYGKNKDAGATDGQIINELLRLKMTDGKNSDFVLALDKLKGKYADFETMLQAAIDDINAQILEKHPGQVDYLIDMSKKDTWGNIRYLAITERTLKDFQATYLKESYYSDTLQTDSGAVRIASCAHKTENKQTLMAFIISLKDGYVLLRQKEGGTPYPIALDLTGSENVTVSPVRYPLPHPFTLDGGTALGYQGQTLFPFDANVTDSKQPAVIRARLTYNVCHEGVCRDETSAEIVYDIPRGVRWETPVCSTLVQAEFNLPSNKKSPPVVTMNDAVLKKDGKEVFLYVSIKLPVMNIDTPRLYITNEDGLLFEEPFYSRDGRQALFRSKLRNPEKLGDMKSVPLNLTFLNLNRSTEIHRDVPVGDSFDRSSEFLFSRIFSSYFYGLEFVVITPLLLAFMLFVNQMLLIAEKNERRTLNFLKGMGKGALFAVLPAYGILFLAGYFVLPEGTFVWGAQLSSPFLNFFYTLLFWTAPLWMMKAFDADFIDSVAEKGQKLFERLNVMTNRQTAGFLVALAVGVLMLFSPMVGSYFELFALLKASPVIYFLCFCAGIATPFLGAAFFAAKAADVPHKNVPLRIPFLFLPAFFQGLLTFVLLGLESGRYIMLGTLVCFAAAGLAWKKMPVTRKTFLRISGALCLFALLFVPFQPNKYSFNTYGALPFDEAALHKAVSEGKAVYLNVSESGCLACQYNRYSMIHNGGYYAIRDGKLLVMTATYDNPFVRRLLQDAGAHILPADILFGPAAPQGRLLPSALKGAETTIAIRGIFAERD